MRTRFVLPAAVVLLVALVACRTGGAPSAGETPLEGKTAPPFKLAKLEGGELSSASLAGKVVLLDFWATWCKPCHEQTRLLNQLYPEVRDRGVEFLAINSGEEVDLVKSFAKPGTFSYPVLLDPTDSLSLELDVVALPTLVVIDKAGKIAFFYEGVLEPAELRKELAKAGA